MEELCNLELNRIGWIKVAFIFSINIFKQNLTYLESILKILVEAAGDTDTNACILGGLIGANIGYNRLPQEQLNNVITCNPSNYKRHPSNIPSNVLTD